MTTEAGAYYERNIVVAALTLHYPAGTRKTEIIGWDPAWHNCVYLDLPTGQVTPGLGGPAVEIVKLHRKGPREGEELGRFLLAKVDAEALGEVDWYWHPAGYWQRQAHLEPPNGLLHRIVAERAFGPLPDGFEVDHINRDKSDSRRENLRLATPYAQKLNQARAGTSVRQKKNGRWQAIWGGKQVSLGVYNTKEEALRVSALHHLRRVQRAEQDGNFIYPPAQVSFHYHDSDTHLFAHLPPYTRPWDGHDKKEAMDRIRGLIPYPP